MSDQSVHEIQLNGKQLVFMFMTATVAAVVIFLCGVMVGRGVDTSRGVEAAIAASEVTVDPTVPPAPSSASEPTSPGAPVAAQEELSYAARLEAPEPPPDPTVEPVSPPVPAIAARAEPPAVVAAARPAPAPAAPRSAPPTTRSTPATTRPAAAPGAAAATAAQGDGFVVQVASLRSKAEADAVAKRLSSKGFPSFVSTPGSAGPRVFRVRVGRYAERREAEAVARRLETEEQFKPWITR
jgi:DedD protein